MVMSACGRRLVLRGLVERLTQAREAFVTCDGSCRLACGEQPMGVGAPRRLLEDPRGDAADEKQRQRRIN